MVKLALQLEEIRLILLKKKEAIILPWAHWIIYVVGDVEKTPVSHERSRGHSPEQ